MEDLVDVRKKQQKMVYFDVGGTVFRVFRDTIQNYPSSLLARLINEFPNFGEETKPLYVDRSPKAFGWILEIYRNGDFASCVPATTGDVLKRELDFYQLPRIADLGLSDLICFNQEAETACRCPGKTLFEALTERKLWNSLPLYVWFYRISPDNKSEYSKELVWFSEQPHSYTQFFNRPTERAMLLGSAVDLHNSQSTWVATKDRRPGGTCCMIRNPDIPAVRRFLQRSAEKYGLSLELTERSFAEYPFPLLVSIAENNC